MPSISVTNPELITGIDLGTASPKLAGVVDVSNFSTLQTIVADDQDLTGFKGVENISALTSVDISDNKIVGALQDFSNNSNCTFIDIRNNRYNGNMTAALPTGIQKFLAGNNNFLRDNSGTIHDFRNLTNLEVYLTTNQSDSFGAVDANGDVITNSDGGTSDAVKHLNWSGPGVLANTAVTTAENIEGAIPESIRVLNLSNTNISKDSKRILLTQLYDTFGAPVVAGTKATNWIQTTAVNGVLYNGVSGNPTAMISVNNQRGIHGKTNPPRGAFEKLLGKHSAVSIHDAMQAIVNAGFDLYGYGT